MTLEEFKADGDWQTIFMHVDPDNSYNYVESNMMGGVDKAGNPTTREVRAFKMDDVIEVIASSDGENDGASWIGLFRTADAFLFVSASCDYTGWDCQAGADAEWHTDLEQAKAMINQSDRERLGLDG